MLIFCGYMGDVNKRNTIRLIFDLWLSSVVEFLKNIGTFHVGY